MFFHVKNPKTGEDFFFDDFKTIERSIAITYSKVDPKPPIHRTKLGEWCVGDVDSPDLLIAKIEMGQIQRGPTHL